MLNLTIVILSAAIIVIAFTAWICFNSAQSLRSRFSGIIDASAELTALNAKLAEGEARHGRFSDLNALDDKLAKVTADLTQAEARRGQFSDMAALDAELAHVNAQLAEGKMQRQRFDESESQRRAKLKDEYTQGVAKFNELKKEITLLEENVEDISFGVYKPHFSFGTPEEYKLSLDQLRDAERQLIRDGEAAVCPTKWHVNNDFKEGARMVRLNTKLILRAFNGECEAALANVAWNNITKMEERIKNSFEAVNKLGDAMKISLTAKYLNLKLNEVRLTHEYEQKKYQDREEQRKIREERREEERALREIEEAREEAEREESRFQKALDKAREEAARATGGQLQKLTEKVSSFEAKLDEARQKKERAISRAQLTKSGFVYVISNIGSFGERVYKIGMTRRLEPMERIYELGGASVPFPFDLHVMLYSDNAPDLEYSLHQLFDERRVNLANPRREFYRDVELQEVEQFVRGRGLSAQFVTDAEAREYRETLAKREARLAKKPPTQAERFDEDLFEAAAVSKA